MMLIFVFVIAHMEELSWRTTSAAASGGGASVPASPSGLKITRRTWAAVASHDEDHPDFYGLRSRPLSYPDIGPIGPILEKPQYYGEPECFKVGSGIYMPVIEHYLKTGGLLPAYKSDGFTLGKTVGLRKVCSDGVVVGILALEITNLATPRQPVPSKELDFVALGVWFPHGLPCGFSQWVKHEIAKQLAVGRINRNGWIKLSQINKYMFRSDQWLGMVFDGLWKIAGPGFERVRGKFGPHLRDLIFSIPYQKFYP